MSVIFNNHGYHYDLGSTHTICGGPSSNRDLLMRKVVMSRLIFWISYREKPEHISKFLINLVKFCLLGRSCRDCANRALTGQIDGKLCFCIDNTNQKYRRA